MAKLSSRCIELPLVSFNDTLMAEYFRQLISRPVSDKLYEVLNVSSERDRFSEFNVLLRWSLQDRESFLTLGARKQT